LKVKIVQIIVSCFFLVFDNMSITLGDIVPLCLF